MIYDSYNMHGYTISLVDGYEIRCVNPHGQPIKTVPSEAKKHSKWKNFLKLRRQHRKDLKWLEIQFKKAMFSREVVHPRKMITRYNLRTNIKMVDFYKSCKDMYVEANDCGGSVIRGFVTGVDDMDRLLVDDVPIEYLKLLHPLEIDNLEEVQIKAISELRVENIKQLFRPNYHVEDGEEFQVERFMEIPVDGRKMFALTQSYGWSRDSKMTGFVEKIFQGKDLEYLVRFQYSLDYPYGKKEWNVGMVEFCVKYGINEQPCRAVDVDKVTFSEAIWEIDKMVNTSRIDDEITTQTLQYRQNIARMYLRSLGINNAEILGNVVKIYGQWGIYAVSLVDARSMWWSNKRYFICIQPNSYAGRPYQGVSFLLGDGVLDDEDLSLAISKIYELADDTHNVDSVVTNQLIPRRKGYANDGMSLEEVELERRKVVM